MSKTNAIKEIFILSSFIRRSSSCQSVWYVRLYHFWTDDCALFFGCQLRTGSVLDLVSVLFSLRDTLLNGINHLDDNVDAWKNATPIFLSDAFYELFIRSLSLSVSLRFSHKQFFFCRRMLHTILSIVIGVLDTFSVFSFGLFASYFSYLIRCRLHSINASQNVWPSTRTHTRLHYTISCSFPFGTQMPQICETLIQLNRTFIYCSLAKRMAFIASLSLSQTLISHVTCMKEGTYTYASVLSRLTTTAKKKNHLKCLPTKWHKLNAIKIWTNREKNTTYTLHKWMNNNKSEQRKEKITITNGA